MFEDLEDFKQYKRKWKDSKEHFKNLEELISAEIVMFNGNTRNNAWVISQQVRWLQTHFECFTKAIRIIYIKEEIKNVEY